MEALSYVYDEEPILVFSDPDKEEGPVVGEIHWINPYRGLMSYDSGEVPHLKDRGFGRSYYGQFLPSTSTVDI